MYIIAFLSWILNIFHTNNAPNWYYFHAGMPQWTVVSMLLGKQLFFFLTFIYSKWTGGGILLARNHEIIVTPIGLTEIRNQTPSIDFICCKLSASGQNLFAIFINVPPSLTSFELKLLSSNTLWRNWRHWRLQHIFFVVPSIGVLTCVMFEKTLDFGIRAFEGQNSSFSH